MAISFNDYNPYVQDQDFFGNREVGLNHPDVNSYVRLKDNGDIEIMANEGLGIILRPAKNSILIYADHVKIMTKEQDGLRWNSLSFNPMATSYNEPTFVKQIATDFHNTYKGVEHFLFDQEEQPTEENKIPVFPQVMVTDPASQEQITWKQYYIKYHRNPPMGSTSFE